MGKFSLSESIGTIFNWAVLAIYGLRQQINARKAVHSSILTLNKTYLKANQIEVQHEHLRYLNLFFAISFLMTPMFTSSKWYRNFYLLTIFIIFELETFTKIIAEAQTGKITFSEALWTNYGNLIIMIANLLL